MCIYITKLAIYKIRGANIDDQGRQKEEMDERRASKCTSNAYTSRVPDEVKSFRCFIDEDIWRGRKTESVQMIGFCGEEIEELEEGPPDVSILSVPVNNRCNLDNVSMAKEAPVISSTDMVVCVHKPGSVEFSVCSSKSGDEFKKCDLSRNQLKLISEKDWKYCDLITTPQQVINIKRRVGEVCKRANVFFHEYVGKDEAVEELHDFISEGGVRPYIRQDENGPSGDNTPNAIACMLKGDGFPAWENMSHDDGSLCTTNLNGVNCSVCTHIQRDWKLNGGDPGALVMKMNHEAVATANKLLDALTLAERAVLHATRTQSDMPSSTHQKMKAGFESIASAVYAVYPAVAAGPLFDSNQSSVIIPRFNAVFEHEKKNGYTNDSYHSQVRQVYNGGVASDGKLELSSRVILKLDTMHRVEGRLKGARIKAELKMMSVDHMNNCLARPSTYSSGLSVSVDDSLNANSQGQVPVRVLCHSGAKMSNPHMVPLHDVVRWRGERTLLRHADRHATHVFRRQNVTESSVAASQSIPYTMPIHLDNPHTDGPCVRPRHSVEVACIGDFVCGVDTQQHQLLLQRDSPPPSANDLDDNEIVGLSSHMQSLSDGLTHLFKDRFRTMEDVRNRECPDALKNAARDLTRYIPFMSALTVSGKVSVGDCIDTCAVHHDDTVKGVLNSFCGAMKTIDMAESRSPSVNAFSKIQPLVHTEALGWVAQVTPLASGMHGLATGNRVALAVKHSKHGTHDITVLLANRSTSTDPEYFSVDPKVMATKLRKASSVRNALDIHEDDPEVVFDTMWREQSPKREWLSLAQTATPTIFSVRWKRSHHDPWNISTFHVSAANTLRSAQTDHSQPYSRMISAKGYPDGKTYTTFNPNWGVKHIQTSTN